MTVDVYDAQLRAILLILPPPPISAEDAIRYGSVLIKTRKQLRALRSNLNREMRIVRIQRNAISHGVEPIARLARKTLGRRRAGAIKAVAAAFKAVSILEVLPYERIRIEVDHAIFDIEQRLLARSQSVPGGKRRKRSLEAL